MQNPGAGAGIGAPSIVKLRWEWPMQIRMACTNKGTSRRYLNLAQFTIPCGAQRFVWPHAGSEGAVSSIETRSEIFFSSSKILTFHWFWIRERYHQKYWSYDIPYIQVGLQQDVYWHHQDLEYAGYTICLGVCLNHAKHDQKGIHHSYIPINMRVIVFAHMPSTFLRC